MKSKPLPQRIKFTNKEGKTFTLKKKVTPPHKRRRMA